MYEEATIQLPAQMSTLAPGIDATYYYIFWLSVFSFVAIMGFAIYFCVKYRRSKNPQSTPPGHHDVLELFWTFAPLLLLLPMFHYGFKQFVQASVAPENSMEIRVKAKKWAWEFYYEGGKLRVPGMMVVPVNQPIKLIMSSEDVLHSFFVPEFRVKRDVVPGMYTNLWFEAVKTTSKLAADGETLEGQPLDQFCTEYCGTSHSKMLSLVHVVSQADYDQWIKNADKKPKSKSWEEWGKDLFTMNACVTCHRIDGVDWTGPALNAKFGTTEMLADGSSVTVDENYIRESILRPQAKIVKGFTAANMPPFVLSDDQLEGLIAYMKSLKN